MSEPLLIERGILLNFSRHGFWAPHPHRLELVRYPTAEHRFQAMKSLFYRLPPPASPAMAHDFVLRDQQPQKAKARGRQLIIDRTSWDAYAPRAMLEALLHKFTQNEDAWHALRETGDRPLVEHRPDPIWGDNLDGSGRNLMGLALMHVRERLCR